MPTKKQKRRPGRATLGLYPNVSRTHLATACGYDISTISGILRGRTKAKLKTALVMARMCGVTVEQLNGDLERERRKFLERRREGEGEAANAAVERMGDGYQESA